jgi:hypothetical protein
MSKTYRRRDLNVRNLGISDGDNRRKQRELGFKPDPRHSNYGPQKFPTHPRARFLVRDGSGRVVETWVQNENTLPAKPADPEKGKKATQREDMFSVEGYEDTSLI